MNTLLRLLQLTDSSFPTGGYAFSHGIEGLHAMGLLRDEAGVRDVALTHIAETLARLELPAVSHAHTAARGSDLPALVELDHLLTALKPVPAIRAASTRMGRRLLEAALPLFPSSVGEQLLAAVREGQASGHHAVAFGVVAQGAEIGRDDALAGFAAAALNGYVAAAVRLGVIGQAAAQRVIAGLEPNLVAAIAAAPGVETVDMGGYAPLLDIAGMRQPDLPARLFAS
jgi:urease accessory protein